MNMELAFGERLKSARNAKGVSQSGAAKYFGITKVGYQNYEYGRRSPSPEMLSRLADYFNVSLDYLFCRSDEPRMPDKEDWAILKQIYKAREDKQDSPKE